MSVCVQDSFTSVCVYLFRIVCKNRSRSTCRVCAMHFIALKIHNYCTANERANETRENASVCACASITQCVYIW